MTYRCYSHRRPIHGLTSTDSTCFLRYSILLFFLLRPSVSMVYLHAPAYTYSFLDAPARFAVPVDGHGICGSLHVAEPLDACSALNLTSVADGEEHVRFVLITRGVCTFEEKVRNAENGGFEAAIIYDDQEKSSLYSMVGDSAGIHIHASFVSKTAGETLKTFARGVEKECCIVSSLDEAAGTVLVISFVSLIVIVIVLAAIMLARNCGRLRLHNQAASMKREAVERFPCFTFRTSYSSNKHTAETCAICLEDYRDGESLRLLPCQHDFHSVCVDSWLMKWGTFCPVCKHEMSR